MKWFFKTCLWAGFSSLFRSFLRRLELRSLLLTLTATSSLALLAVSLVSLDYLSDINSALERDQTIKVEIKLELERTGEDPAVMPLYRPVWQWPDKLKAMGQAGVLP